MTEKYNNSSLVIKEKNGVPIYAANPSIPSPASLTNNRPRRKQIGDEQKGLIIDASSGEILGRGAAIMYEWEEVDNERFVKLFIGGLKKAAGLSKTGLQIFEIVYNQMRQSPNTDRIELSFWLVSQHYDNINERTYQRGVKELLERNILYRSPTDGLFFVDITCMFNGDRLAFVKGYHLKGSSKQAELPLDTPQPALSLDNDS